MKHEYYKISRKGSCWTARLKYAGKTFDFTFDPGIKHIKQVGLAILGKRPNGKYSLCFPIEFKDLNAKENLLYSLISDIDHYQYSSGLLIAIKDKKCLFVNIDKYEIEFERVIKLYMAHNNYVSKGYLENTLKDFYNHKMTTVYFDSKTYPYIKGRYLEKGSFIVNVDDLDYAAFPHESEVFPLPEYALDTLEKAEYLIPQSLIKVSTSDGKEYIASKDGENKLYDKIFEFKGSFLFKLKDEMRHILRQSIRNYKIYGFMKDGKFAKISVYSVINANLCYELSFEDYEQSVNLSTLKLMKTVTFSCSPVDIWRVDTFTGRTLIIMKHKDEQALVHEY